MKFRLFETKGRRLTLTQNLCLSFHGYSITLPRRRRRRRRRCSGAASPSLLLPRCESRVVPRAFSYFLQKTKTIPLSISADVNENFAVLRLSGLFGDCRWFSKRRLVFSMARCSWNVTRLSTTLCLINPLLRRTPRTRGLFPKQNNFYFSNVIAKHFSFFRPLYNYLEIFAPSFSKIFTRDCFIFCDSRSQKRLRISYKYNETFSDESYIHFHTIERNFFILQTQFYWNLNKVSFQIADMIKNCPV